MSDPTRLGDPRSDSPEILRRLIRAGQSEVPETARLRGMADRLGFGLGAAGAGAGVAKGVTIGLAAGATKIGATAVLVLGAGAGALAVGHHLAKVPPVVLVQPPSGNTTIPHFDPRVAVTAPSSAEPSLPAAQPAPIIVSPSVARRRSMTLAATLPRDAPTVTAPATPVDTELSLLEQAQRTLHDDPRRALDLADRDAEEYPAGTLAQEREAIAIEALVRLGQRGEARARAARFFDAFPGSAHGPRIRSILGLDPEVHNP